MGPGAGGAAGGSDHGFLSTRWSLVRSARLDDTPAARAALGELCELYWSPLYAYLRGQGLDPERAADTVQGFCARLLEKRDLGDLAPERGRFRAFMLAALRHHLSHEREHDAALKRGGGRTLIAIDPERADRELGLATQGELSPEQAYERQWARALLARAVQRVRAEYAAAGKGELFELLKPVLQGEELAGVEALAAQAGLTPGALKVAGTRLRQRYRESLRGVIGDTVESPAEVEDEIRALFAALAARPRS